MCEAPLLVVEIYQCRGTIFDANGNPTKGAGPLTGKNFASFITGAQRADNERFATVLNKFKHGKTRATGW